MGNDRTRRSRLQARAPERAARNRGVPPFDVAPIIPVLRSHPFNDPDWLFEPNYDGFRSLLYLAAGACLIRSKRGTTFKRFAFFHRLDRLETHGAYGAVGALFSCDAAFLKTFPIELRRTRRIAIRATATNAMIRAYSLGPVRTHPSVGP
jgi:hypothetical protein